MQDPLIMMLSIGNASPCQYATLRVNRYQVFVTSWRQQFCSRRARTLDGKNNDDEGMRPKTKIHGESLPPNKMFLMMTCLGPTPNPDNNTSASSEWAALNLSRALTKPSDCA